MVRACCKLVMSLLGGLVFVAVASNSTTPVQAERAPSEQTVVDLNQRIQSLAHGGRAQAAYELINPYEAAVERVFGRSHIEFARARSWRGALEHLLGRPQSALRSFEEAAELYAALLPPDAPELGLALKNVGIQYLFAHRPIVAVRSLEQALQILDAALPDGHPELVSVLSNLASGYQTMGRYDDALPILERAVEMGTAAGGAQGDITAVVKQNFAAALEQVGEFKRAEKLLREVLEVRSVGAGGAVTARAGTLAKLAENQLLQGRYKTAERYFEQSISLLQKARGPRHPELANALMSMSRLHIEQGRLAEAQRALETARTIYAGAYLTSHPSVATTDSKLAEVAWLRGREIEAADHARRATKIYVEQRLQLRIVELHHARSMDYLWSLYSKRHRDPRRGDWLEEAFELAQRLAFSTTAATVERMSSRLEAAVGELAAEIRQEQDLERREADVEQQIVALLGQAGTRSQVAELRQELGAIRSRRKATREAVLQRFPEYARLTQPQPVPLGEVKSRLSSDAALLTVVSVEDATHVFAITKDEARWVRVALSGKEMAARVGELRVTLSAADTSKLFDLDASADLYKAIFGPVEDVFAEKGGVFFVLSGPLTQLPPHVLLTEPPNDRDWRARPQIAYRTASWLMRRHAVTIAPSVAVISRQSASPKRTEQHPLLGFGDPRFSLLNREKSDVSRAADADAGRGGMVFDMRRLAASLPQLPETAEELRAVAEVFGSGPQSIKLGESATELSFRTSDLAQYRVLYLATHALVTGEVAGLEEPAFVLSLPDRPSARDDGVVTASEVADLKLDADLVVLSACNTAAGENSRTDALSGLAKAFFFAGARGLLVSHWPVFSDATATLMKRLFSRLEEQNQMELSGALRDTMLEMLEQGDAGGNPHPAIWAPFVVVGSAGNVMVRR